MSTKRVFVFLLTVLGLLISSIIITRNNSVKNDDVYYLLNTSGRQRMLSHSLLGDILKLNQNWSDSSLNQTLRNDITVHLSEFEHADTIVTASIHQHHIEHLINQSYPIYKSQMLSDFKQCLNSYDKNTFEQHYAKAIESQKLFVEQMEKVVKVFQYFGMEVHNKNYRLDIGTAILTFIFTIISFLFVIVPGFRSIQIKNRELESRNRQLQEIEQTLKDKYKETVKLNESLNYSRNQYKVFIEQAPGAIAMFDTDMKYLVASQKWYSDYGLTNTSIIGKSHYEIFPEISEEWKKIHQECLAGDISKNQEAPFYRADGSIQWLQWEVRPWKNEEDEIGGLLMYTDDITAYKKLKSEQERLLEILDRTCETANIGVWDFNIHTREIIWDSMMYHIFRIPHGEVITLTKFISIFKESGSMYTIANALKELFKHGGKFDIELKFFLSDGPDVWIRVIGEYEKHPNNPKIIGIVQDITKIKQQEINISNLLIEINSILNSATEISIISTDTDGIITHFNTGAEKLLQYTKEEMIGKHTPLKLHTLEEIEQSNQTLTNNLIDGFEAFSLLTKNGKPDTREWTYIRKDGSTIKVLLSVTSLKDESDNIRGFLYVATDLTELNKLKVDLLERNISLEKLTSKLTEQNLTLANFAHITSHNLRSPVINLNSLMHFYSESETDEEKQDIMQKFEIVIKHLTETLNSLIEALKIKQSAHENIEYISFEKTLVKTMEICTGQIMEIQPTITIDFSQVSGIEYKKDYMDSIFLNLLTNAFKYRSKERDLILDIKSIKTDQNTTQLIFSDNGSGIDLTRHGNKIFGLNKTFHRQDKESKGVGLFIVKNQVEALGGTISIASEVEKGTTFTIEFI